MSDLNMTLDWLLESGVAEAVADDVFVRVKAVPGAKRSEISGILGDRLKIRVAAPPEGGKANKAICELITDALNLKKKQVTIQAGHASPEKVIHITR